MSREKTVDHIGNGHRRWLEKSLQSPSRDVVRSISCSSKGTLVATMSVSFLLLSIPHQA